MSSFNLRSLSRTPLKVSHFALASTLSQPVESTWDEIQSMRLLSDFAQRRSLLLDFSLNSLELLEAEFVQLSPAEQDGLTFEVAYYLGEALCRLVPACHWQLQDGYPEVATSVDETWDVIYFVGARERPARPRLQDGLAHLLLKYGAADQL